MTSPYQRTQVYLAPEDHQRLRRLAADRGQSMTDLVREAVGNYLADEVDDTYPDLDELQDDLEEATHYASLPRGPAGLLARSRVRADAVHEEEPQSAGLASSDRIVGEALWREHTRHLERTETPDPDR